ncbi:MAG: hypothetical protein GX344_00190 [Intrasporangiaceae bacterium]|nr:hypothetical protein [Intrasporangiaceae bacterium]
MSDAMNAVSAVFVRALAVIFVLAMAAFVADLFDGGTADLVDSLSFWVAVLVALLWGFADGRVSRTIVVPLVLWLLVSIVVLIGAGFVLKTVAERGQDDSLSWLSVGWRPMLMALLPGAAGAAIGFFGRDYLPERFRPWDDEYGDDRVLPQDAAERD